MKRLEQFNFQLSKQSISKESFNKTETEVIEEGRIAIIYLNSPGDLNKLSPEMISELVAHLKKFHHNTKVKVILILSKVKKAFCAGADISTFPSLTYEIQLIKDIWEELRYVMDHLTKPVIAGVNGFALGGGFEFALSCDIIFAGLNAQFGFPEVKLGLIPGLGGTQRLTRLCGKTKAMRYILSGDFFDAKKAYEMNVVSELTDDENLHDAVIKFAKNIAQKSLHNLVLARKSVNAADELSLSQGLKYEKDIFDSLLNMKSAKVGVEAFLNKKTANFKDI